MKTIALFKRRTLWCPTLLGWAVLLILTGTPFLLWCFQAEPLLSATQRQPPEVLVVEGWIGLEGLAAAKEEFVRGHYDYVVASGGLSGNLWDRRRWSFASEAEEQLLKLGIPADRVILAVPRNTEEHRTYESALAVRQALLAKGIQPKHLTVFTLGMHARRSRLVFAKVLGSGTEVGVISWVPADYLDGPWWRSSNRALELIKETVGYTFEVLFNSGRPADGPGRAKR